MRIRSIVATASIALLAAACATESSTISATYVAPTKYEERSCEQLDKEYTRVLAHSNAVNQKQDDIATNDAVATGVGVILFWPALFFIEGDDESEEVARMKGELNAIDEAASMKECTELSDRIMADRTAAVEASN